MTPLSACEEVRTHERSDVAGGHVPRHELIGPPGAPVVVALGGLSAGAHVTATERAPARGWWEEVVGRGRAVDVERFQVLAIDWLDGPGDGIRDTVTTDDQADALARVLDAAGIERAHLVIGASYGGMVALAFGARHPERAERLVVISAAHESHPFSTGLRAIQRRIVRLGTASGHEREALGIARALGMTTYRSAAEFAERFAPVVPEPGEDGLTFDVERYLLHQGGRIASHFDARRFLALSLSTDLHRVRPEDVRVPALLVAADLDTLVPREQMEELARRLGAPCRLVRVASRVGHDSFLAEPGLIGPVLADVLARGDVA